ncbi:MAG: hypothetical protein JO288_02545 [Hyphomicrobiales bacterium]|nr:hypothetical protein [Hyphomicrobiales bacterium]
MTRGLFRDAFGWVEVDYGGTQSPIPPQKYIDGHYQPPFETLPLVAPPQAPEHWRSRAEEARTIAEQMSDLGSIATMLKVADQYEGLARDAEQQIARRG